MSIPEKRKPTGLPSSSASPVKKQALSGSITASGPTIRSWLAPKPASFKVDELAKDNQKLFDMIKAYLDTLDVNDRRLRDTRKRNIKNKVSAVAALASLYMTHHDRKWSQWREDLDESPPLTNIHLRYIEQFDRQTQRLISYWSQKAPVAEERSGIKRPSESQKAQRRVHDRYGGRCVLTGHNWGSQAAHIVASSISRNPESRFWEALSAFWTGRQVNRLKKDLQDPKVEEQNLLMLDIGIHNAWTAGRLAFKPLPPTDSHRLELEVHILSNVSPGSVIHEQIRYPDGILKYMANITDSRTGKVIQTGDIINIVTDDPKEHPLPSWELLMLQYQVQRVLRAVTAVEPLTMIFRGDMTPDAAELRADVDEEYIDRHLDAGFCDLLIHEAMYQEIIPIDSGDYWRGLLYESDSYSTSETSDTSDDDF